MKKLLLTILIIILTCLGMTPAPAHAAGLDRGIMKVEFLYAIEYAGGRTEKLREPMDICFDRKKGEFYVVDAAVDKIYVYDKNGMFVQAIELKNRGEAPGRLAVDGAGRIYLTYLRNARVSLLDYKGEPLDEIRLPGTIDVPGASVRPTDLATGKDGEVYTLKSSGGLVRIDPDNIAHEEISITAEGAPNTISGMTVTGDGKFLFTDMRPYSVASFDPARKEYKRIGTAGVLYGQLARPQGIATDDAGHIFVVSTITGKVSIYDRDGTFIEEFGEFGSGYGQFYMASKIASDGKDRLFVLENMMKRVQVFKIEFLKDKEVMLDSANEPPVGKR